MILEAENTQWFKIDIGNYMSHHMVQQMLRQIDEYMNENLQQP